MRLADYSVGLKIERHVSFVVLICPSCCDVLFLGKTFFARTKCRWHLQKWGSSHPGESSNCSCQLIHSSYLMLQNQRLLVLKKKHNPVSQSIFNQLMRPSQSAGKGVRSSPDWFWFYF